MRMLKIRLRTLMGMVALVALLLWLVDCFQVSLGRGRTNLKFTFVIADAMTMRPIEGATIDFLKEYATPGSAVAKTTDPAGKFIREARMKVASGSGCWETSYATSPPDIKFRISAPGYVTTDWMAVGSQCLLPPVSAVDVKVRLVKSPSLSTKSAVRVQFRLVKSPSLSTKSAVRVQP